MMTQVLADEVVPKQQPEPILFRSDSSQRKNDVLIHQSKRFPNKCSEWYFVRRNKNTLNETYRCVHCRSIHEKARRRRMAGHSTNAEEFVLRPGARIIVHNQFFITNPDFPLGSHICDFENNPTSDAHIVWSRRALIRANSELRLNPEKPKLKFQKMLHSIEQGEGEYSYLSPTTRRMIVENLTSEKGFDSRRRSFARNNSLALKRLREKQLRAEIGIDSIPFKFNDYKYTPSRDLLLRPTIFSSTKCGMPGCNQVFQNVFERDDHRSLAHQDVFFIDSFEEFTEYRNLVLKTDGKRLDDVITTEFGQIVDVAMFEKNGDTNLDFYVIDDMAVVPSLNDAEFELNDSFVQSIYNHSNDEKMANGDVGRTTSTKNQGSTETTNDQSAFLSQIDYMLKQIHDYARAVSNYPIRRDVVESTIYNAMSMFMGEYEGKPEKNSHGTTAAMLTQAGAYACCPPPLKRKRPNILSVQKLRS